MIRNNYSLDKNLLLMVHFAATTLASLLPKAVIAPAAAPYQ
jgi:hypothetical protein